MANLTPNMSASLAKIVYQLTDAPNLSIALLRIEQSYGSIMDINKENMTTAKTGGPGFIKSRSAFGFTCLGKGTYQP